MSKTVDQHDDEFSVLDILVVLAESWVFLLVVPIFAGLTVVGIWQLRPHAVTSSVMIAMPQQEVEAALTESFIMSAVGLHGAESSAAEIMSGLSVLGQENSRAVISLELSDPNDVQALLTSISRKLDRTLGREFLRARRDEIQQQVGEVERLLAVQGRAVDSLERGLERFDTENADDMEAYVAAANSLVSLTSSFEALLESRMTLIESLTAIPSSVVVSPASPERRTGIRPVVAALLATKIVGASALILVLFRAGLRGAMSTPDGSAKIARIRRAFWLR